MWWLISLQTLISWITFSFTLSWRDHLAISSSLFSSSLNHFSELLMLPNLFLFFLFFIKCSLLSLLLKSTSCPCESISFLIFKNRLIINILNLWKFRYDGLTIMWNFLSELIVLHVNNSYFAHFQQYFRYKLFSFNFVIRDIQGTNILTLYKSYNILKTSYSYTISLQLKVA